MYLRERSHGFTLLEMLVVLAIAMILLSVAAPSFSNLMAQVRLKTTAEMFVAHLNLARSEAIKRNSRAVLCKSFDGLHCASAGGWDQGWMVFHDANDNAQVDVDEEILMQQAALKGMVRFAGNTNVTSYVSYTPTGGANMVSGAFQAGTFTLCTHSDPPVQALQIVISKAGQVRVAKAGTDACGQV